MASSGDMDQVRAELTALLARARVEPEFARSIRTDPRTYLGEAGVVEPLMEDVMQELGIDGPIGLSSQPTPKTPHCQFTCDAISCIVTICGCVPQTN